MTSMVTISALWNKLFGRNIIVKIDLTKFADFFRVTVSEIDFKVIVEGFRMVAAGASVEEGLVYVWLAHHADAVAKKLNKPVGEVKETYRATAEAMM